jgi:hypothetical protein
MTKKQAIQFLALSGYRNVSYSGKTKTFYVHGGFQPWLTEQENSNFKPFKLVAD